MDDEKYIQAAMELDKQLEAGALFRSSDLIVKGISESKDVLFALADMKALQFVYVNAAFRSALGYSFRELTSRSFMDFIKESEMARTQKAAEINSKRTAIAGKDGLQDFVNIYVDVDSRPVYLQWIDSVVIDEQHLLTTCRVTTRDRYQASLKEYPL